MTEKPVTEDLKTRAREALDGVTRGPWVIGIETEVYADGECDTWITLGPENYDAVAIVVNEHTKSDGEVGLNARFIAASRQLVPDLLSALGARDARIADLEAQLLSTCKREAETIQRYDQRIERLEAEIARLRDALKDGVDLIAGDAVGVEWKLGCRDFLAKARATLSEGDTK